MTWESIIQTIVSIVGGAATSGIPLYIMLRKARIDATKTEDDNALSNRSRENEIEAANKISVEAEWKRLLDFRQTELLRLQARDNEQEAKIVALQAQHMECQVKEARNDERIKMNEERIRTLEAMIFELKGTPPKRKRDAISNRDRPESTEPAAEPSAGE